MKRNVLNLTVAEKEVLLQATNAYLEILDKKKADVAVFLNEGAQAGLISGGGDNWERDKPLYDLRDKIRLHIEEEAKCVFSMRGKIFDITR